MSQITVQNIKIAVQHLNEMLPRHEIMFEHFLGYRLNYHPKGTTTAERLVTLATKQECFDCVHAMIKAIELSQATQVKEFVYPNRDLYSPLKA